MLCYWPLNMYYMCFSYGSDDTLRYTKIFTSWKYRNRYSSNRTSLLLRARLAQLACTATELWEYVAGQCTSVQKDLDSLLAWSNKWKMKFNPAKCNVISISRKSVVPNFKYCLDNNFLQHTDKIVDLGVIIDTKLSTRDHVVKTASKAHTVLGKIKRAVGYDSLDSVIRQLYLSHVRSVLEYCSPVWSPYLVTEIASLEKVQRRATKFIPNDFSDISYRDRCIKLSLLPLSFRK